MSRLHACCTQSEGKAYWFENGRTRFSIVSMRVACDARKRPCNEWCRGYVYWLQIVYDKIGDLEIMASCKSTKLDRCLAGELVIDRGMETSSRLCLCCIALRLALSPAHHHLDPSFATRSTLAIFVAWTRSGGDAPCTSVSYSSDISIHSEGANLHLSALRDAALPMMEFAPATVLCTS